MEYRDIFNGYLQERDLRLTRVREIILNAVFETHSHFDAEELYDFVRAKGVSRATVYRTIPLLVDSGLVKKSLVIRNKEKYEHIYGHPNHFHIICKNCGRVVEQTDKYIDSEVTKLTEKIGFKFIDYNLRINGICPLCKD